MFTTIKRFSDFPCSHRQHTHDGACRYVHGYSRWFEFEFWSPSADPNTLFIVDFGKLKWLKAQLTEWFDHTLLLNADDPELPFFQEAESRGAAKLTVLPNVGMEAVAIYLWSYVEARLRKEQSSVRLIRCRVGENDKNSGEWKVNPSVPCPPHYRWLYQRYVVESDDYSQAVKLQGINLKKYMHPDWLNIVFPNGDPNE